MKTLVKRAIKQIPRLESLTQSIRGNLRAQLTRLTLRNHQSYHCPICDYRGPFLNFKDPLYPIYDTLCPRCDLYERHRLQFLVMGEIGKRLDFAQLSMLHFAPEQRFSEAFRGRFAKYQTADIAAHGVDYQVDIRALPFADASFDVIFASHVLEHVDNDAAAIKEIHRVLRPNGFALLPVPIVSPHTIEYGAPNPREFGHVRACGVDYFDRYRAVFANVEVHQSTDFPAEYQLYTYESRIAFPSEASPKRVAMPGSQHPDFVPVCYKTVN